MVKTENMIHVTIDGVPVTVPERTTILHAAKAAGIKIPTLCYWEGLNEIGACRVCVVEVEGYDRLITACNNTVTEGMVIRTNSKKARMARKTNVELILSEHNSNCATCVRSGNCTLQTIANDLNIQALPFEKKIPEKTMNPDFPLQRDYSKCIKCMRCVQVCDHIQVSNIWDLVNTGSRTTVDVKDAYRLEDSACALCGQCITHCPVGALKERDDTEKVLRAIDNPDKIVLVQIAPSIRTAWGEYFGLAPDVATVELLGTALRRVGVDYVFDTNFSADLTIMEEGSEFLERLRLAAEGKKDGGSAPKFPMFTSCCPGWVRFVKAHYPGFVDNLSTAKSPQQMFGAVAKSYYAELLGVSPSKIYSVSIMPCLAKKHECAIPCMNDACGEPDVDAVLTTREVVRLIREAQVTPQNLTAEALDAPLGTGSGAGNIFGATGGVMEAALRSAYFLVTGKNPDADAFRDVRSLDYREGGANEETRIKAADDWMTKNGSVSENRMVKLSEDGIERTWKEAVFDLAGTELHVAVANGLGNADRLLKAIQNGEVSYDFVEIMACPGGCVGGGGQPIEDGAFMAEKRAPVLYAQDARGSLRFSHENPSITDVYKNYFGAPLSEKSHHLLHTDHHRWRMPSKR